MFRGEPLTTANATTADSTANVPTLLLGKPPLRHKMQKNNVFFRDKSARCRQIVIV